MNIQEMREGFQKALREVQAREVVLIPEGVDVGEYLSLRISFRRVSEMGVFNKGLDSSVFKANRHWRKR